MSFSIKSIILLYIRQFSFAFFVSSLKTLYKGAAFFNIYFSESFFTLTVIIEPEPPSVTLSAIVPETKIAEQPKPQMPSRPIMPPEAAAFLRLQKVKVTLDKHNNLIFEAESERTKLEIELSDLKELARLTKKKELENRIATKTEEIRTLKAGLSGIVRQHGFATVQDFHTAFYTAQRAIDAYQKECAK